MHVADVEGLLGPRATGAFAVVGIPHPRFGEVVAIVLEHADDAHALRALSRASLAPSAQPRRWFTLDPLPRTDLGKVDRAHLVALVASGTVRALP